MGKGCKCALHHLVLKVGGVAETSNFYGQVLIDAKMFGPPGDEVPCLAETSGSSRNGFFIRFLGRVKVYFYASGKIEAYFLGGVDFCMEMDGFQGVFFWTDVSTKGRICSISAIAFSVASWLWRHRSAMNTFR